MNATDITTETASPTTSPGLDAVWQRAKKREMQRLPLIMVVATAFMFIIGMMDTTTWPPQLHTGRWVLAAVMAGIFCVLLLGLSIRQKTSSPERYVSPLLGLEPDARRTARADLKAARPATDPLLREVEIARAQQLALHGPSSLGAALVPVAFQALAMVIMFVSDSPVLGGLFALSTVVNGWSAWQNYRNTQDARRFLAALGTPQS